MAEKSTSRDADGGGGLRLDTVGPEQDLASCEAEDEEPEEEQEEEQEDALDTGTAASSGQTPCPKGSGLGDLEESWDPGTGAAPVLDGTTEPGVPDGGGQEEPDAEAEPGIFPDTLKAGTPAEEGSCTSSDDDVEGLRRRQGREPRPGPAPPAPAPHRGTQGTGDEDGLSMSKYLLGALALLAVGLLIVSGGIYDLPDGPVESVVSRDVAAGEQESPLPADGNDSQQKLPGSDPGDPQSVHSVSLLLDKLAKENQEIRLMQAELQAHKEELQALLRRSEGEAAAAGAQQRSLAAENARLRAALEHEAAALRDARAAMKWLSVLPQQCIFLMTCLLMALEAVPIDIDKTKVKAEGHVEGEKVENPDTGLYYDEYLRQVIDVLETDKHFREKLQTADIEEIKSGKLSRELDLVSHHVRTRLDELKRQEVARLRMLIKAKMDSVQDTGIDHQALLKQFEHLNHQNPDTFEPKDLDMLIKAATSDLENYDKTRHEEFKKYEMMKEHERREYLKTLDEEKRKREESKFEEMKKKHGDHPKVHHPGSKDQLKEVWEEADGLDPNEFDPKTFFKLHDVNTDGYLDEQELEALFTKELEKVYDPKNEEDDMVEMEEERLRMREHVMNEVDINKDRLVTLEEFLRATEKKEFLEPDSWETLDQQQLFTEDELKEFESHISQQENELRKKAEDLQKQKEELQRQHDQLQAQKQELQQVVKQMEQKKLQQGNPPAGPAGELKFQPPGEHKVGDAPKHPAGGDQPLPPGHGQESASRTDQVHP